MENEAAEMPQVLPAMRATEIKKPTESRMGDRASLPLAPSVYLLLRLPIEWFVRSLVLCIMVI